MSGSDRPSGLTASAVELLIRCYWSPTALEDWENVGNQTQESELIAHGLLHEEAISRMPTGSSRLTPRGQVYAEYILNLPLPEQVWRMPGQQKPSSWQ